MDDKIKNYKFIKDFSKITVTKICKDLDINRQNVFTNKASSENIAKVKNEIDNKIKDLYNGDKTDSL